MPARTCLFVPGNRPERFAKALGSGADAVVLDLEDARGRRGEGRGAQRDCTLGCRRRHAALVFGTLD